MSSRQIEADRLANMQHYGFGPEAMRKIKVCKKCGAMSEEYRQFCKECGTRLPPETLYQTYKKRHSYCEVCDTVVSESTRYCPQCGTKLKRKDKAP